MSEPSNKTKNRAGLVFLLSLTVVALYFCYVLIAPFLRSILFLRCLSHSLLPPALAYRPPYSESQCVRTLVHVLGRPFHRVVNGIPWAGTRNRTARHLPITRQRRRRSERLSLYVIHIFERVVELVSSYLPISATDLRAATVNQAEKGVSLLLGMTAGALGSFTTMLAYTFIAFFVLFFLLRDGKAMLRRTAVLLPLRTSQTTRLFALVKDTLNATVYGTLAMAALQGTLAGIAFWFLGVVFCRPVGNCYCSMCIVAVYWNRNCSSARNLNAPFQRSLDQRPRTPCVGTGRRPPGGQFVAPPSDR